MRRQVTNAVDAGDGDHEASVLRRKLAADPTDLSSRLAIAEHYRKLGFPDVALEHYRLAAARFPDSSEVHVHLAQSLREMSLTDEALETLVKFCKKQQSPSADAWSLMGILYDDVGEFTFGEHAYRAALGVDSKRDAVHNNLGYNLLLQGKTDAAAEELRRALALNPRSEIARNNLGMALAATPREALLQMQSVSDAATAHSNLAAVLIEQKRYAEARQEIKIALNYSPNHVAALSNLELLSELDGKPASFELTPRVTGWKRVTLFVRRTLTGEPKVNHGEAANSPTRVETATR
jgi:Flp pilus assembly protein TadD